MTLPIRQQARIRGDLLAADRLAAASDAVLEWEETFDPINYALDDWRAMRRALRAYQRRRYRTNNRKEDV